MSKLKKSQRDKISREFLSVLVRGSLDQRFNKLPGSLNEYCFPRFDYLKRKYGYAPIVLTIPHLLDLITLNPFINMKHRTEGDIKLTVISEPLSNYYDRLIK